MSLKTRRSVACRVVRKVGLTKATRAEAILTCSEVLRRHLGLSESPRGGARGIKRPRLNAGPEVEELLTRAQSTIDAPSHRFPTHSLDLLEIKEEGRPASGIVLWSELGDHSHPWGLDVRLVFAQLFAGLEALVEELWRATDADRAWIVGDEKRCFLSDARFGSLTIVRDTEALPADVVSMPTRRGLILRAFDGSLDSTDLSHIDAIEKLHRSSALPSLTTGRDVPIERPQSLPAAKSSAERSGPPVDTAEETAMLPQLGAAPHPASTMLGLDLGGPALPFHPKEAPIQVVEQMPDETSMMPIISSSGPEASYGPSIDTVRPSNAPSRSGGAAVLPFRYAKDGEGARVGTGTRFLPNREGGMTVAPGATAPERSLPFAKSDVDPQNVDLSLFPIERYAQVTAALASGEARPAVLRRFVMTEEMWVSLTHAWAQRFDAEPHLAVKYRELIVEARQTKT